MDCFVALLLAMTEFHSVQDNRNEATRALLVSWTSLASQRTTPWCKLGAIVTDGKRLPEPAKLLRMGSYILFLLSLVSIAFVAQYGGHEQHTFFGGEVLITGPLGLKLDFRTNWPWLGNLALFCASLALYVRANVVAGIFAAMALVTGVWFFAVSMVTSDVGAVCRTRWPVSVLDFGYGSQACLALSPPQSSSKMSA